MTSYALLTKRSKPILTLSLRRRSVSSSLGPALPTPGLKPNPPPSVLVHPVRRLSSSLAQDQNLRFGFGPIIRLQLRLEPLFFIHQLPSYSAWQHFALSVCDPSCDAGYWLQRRRSWWTVSSKVSGPGQRPPAPPIPSGGAFLLSIQRSFCPAHFAGTE